MTFLELSQQVLQQAKYPLDYNQMWESAKNLGLDKKVSSEGKTPELTIRALIYVDMKEKKDSIFCIASKRPTKFWLKSRKNELEGKSSQKNEFKNEEQLGLKAFLKINSTVKSE